MKKWKCSVCGYVEDGGAPPEKCPVCGRDKSKFISEGEAPAAEQIVPDETIPQKSSKLQWKCTVCGYIHVGEEPPEICPVCGADKTKFILVGEEDHLPTFDEEALSQQPSAPTMECSVCGYIHKAYFPPAQCPVCGADKLKFVLIEGTNESFSESDQQTRQQRAAKTNLIARYAERFQLITQLHGHPIAVHIPNGVLPLAIFFTVLAFLFKSDAIATAAKINMFFVCIFMPVVLFTGVLDWYNRFMGRMSRVFLIKMICGGIVFFLSLIISVWWILSPDLFTAGIQKGGLFILLNFANLAAAATAGFYGGKLVFNQ